VNVEYPALAVTYVCVGAKTRPTRGRATLLAKDEVEDVMKNVQLISRFRASTLAASFAIVCAMAGVAYARPKHGASPDSGKGPQLLIGSDDDRQDNAAIQAGAAANQSLNRTDVLNGGQGNDVIFGLNGNDVIDGGQGADIILGGPDGGAAPGGPPNSDIMFGGQGDDVNLWAPGDGSEAFIGGPGRDAIIFGATDRDTVADPATGVRLPTLAFGVDGFPQGVPTADVSGLANFCTIEASPLSGFDHLVRFRGAAGNIIVTVRVSEVEQVFCSLAGAIGFADLTLSAPVFVPVSQADVQNLNPLVAAMIR
jgi:hemolysin type calcium-binding protein